MRLYDSKSCTPVGGVTSKPLKSWSPKSFGHTWSLGVHHSSRSVTSTMTSESRKDEADFPDDERSSLMPGAKPLNRRSRSVPRTRSYGVSLTFPKISRQHSSYDSRKMTMDRHALWSPSMSRVPFKLVQNKDVDGEDNSWRRAHSCNCDKKNHTGDIIPQTPAKQMTTKHNSTSVCEFSPTESTSDDSSSAWLEFSVDGSDNNPFLGNRTPASSFRFMPIEKPPEQRSVMMIKPTPVQRTKSSHALFPSPDSLESAHFYEYDGNTLSAFSSPNIIASLSQGKKRMSRNPVSRQTTMNSTPRLTPSPRDVDPIVGSAVRRIKGQAEAKMLVDLAKYSSMLKSRVPLALVKKIMEREGVSSSIIELATAAHNSGIEFGDGGFD